MTRHSLAFLAAFVLCSPAYAGTGTITVLDSTGTTRTYDVVTDGSGNFVSKFVACDVTAAANCAAVKAASTAAGATDPALVVAISPNNSAAVTNAGTFAVQATLQASGTTAIGKVDPNTIATWGLMSGTTPGTAPTNTLIAGAIYNSSAPTATTGQTLPLQTDASGNLLVNIKAGAGSGGTALADGATFTIGTTSETPAACTYVSGGITVTSGKSSVLSCTAAASLNVNVTNTNANGQATMANSSPVVIASNQSTLPANTAQVNGVTTLTGTGAVGTGAQRVAVGTDTATIAGSAPGTAGTASSNVVTVQGVASMTPLAVSYGGTALVADPCQSNTKLNATVSQTSSGTLITGTSGKKNYICSFSALTSAAAEISLVEYSGTCTGGTAYATLGSTTAASGLPLGANGGVTYGSGGATVVSGAGNTNTGYNVCLLQAGSATVVAQATYVQQ